MGGTPQVLSSDSSESQTSASCSSAFPNRPQPRGNRSFSCAISSAVTATGRILASKGAARRPPLRQINGRRFRYFFCLHFWTDVEVLLEPSANVVVAVLLHFFFLQRAIT